MFGMFFFLGLGLLLTGFVMGYISPKRGRLIFLLLIAVFSAIAIWPIDVTKINYKELNESLLNYYVFCSLTVLIGIHFGSKKGGKIPTHIADAK